MNLSPPLRRHTPIISNQSSPEGVKYYPIAKIETFNEFYSLTPGAQRRLESVLSGSEVAIKLNYAMVERLKEQATLVKMQFLAAAIIWDSWIRIYFASKNDIHVKDIPFHSKDPNRDIFEAIACFDVPRRYQVMTEDYYLEIRHRPN